MLRVRDFNRNRLFQFIFITLFLSIFVTSFVYAAVFTQGNVLVYTKDRIYEYTLSGTRVQKISVPSLSFSQHGITMTTNNRVAINDVNKLHLYDSNNNQWSTISSVEVDAGLNSGDGKIAAYCNFVFTGDSLGNSRGIVRYDVLQKNIFRDQNLVTSNISIGLDGFFYIGLNKYNPVTLENIEPAKFLTPPNNIIDRVANKSGTQFVISSSPYHAIYRVSKTGVREAVLYSGYYRVQNLIDIDINDAGKIVVGNIDGQVLITDENFKSIRIIDLSSDENSIPAYVAFVSSVQGFNVNKFAATVSNSVFLNSETCTKLQAGNVAQYINQSAAVVSQTDIANYYASLGMDTSVVIDAQNLNAPYYSVDILNTKSGNSPFITIPLNSALQQSSKLKRLMMPQGWADFIVNSANTVFSSKTINGKCPLPGNSAYISGLNLNDNCLQLRVEDGGPNDADGKSNKHVQLVAGITIISDSDGDGVPDTLDAFPLDPTETKDSDGDGVGDNKDAFPFDSTETKDTDGDGVGDNLDAFPFDATETKDSDGDGVGDNKDQYPNDSSRSVITLSSYYPQHKDNNWLYNTSSEKAVFIATKTINKINLLPLQLTNDLRLYLRSSDAGIGISGLNIDGLDTQTVSGVISGDILFDSEIPVLFTGMVTGNLNSSTDRGQINIQPIIGFRAMNYQVDSRYIGLETVSVPYGSFRAHRVILTIKTTTSGNVNNAPFNISISLVLWFGLDTGIIKYQVISKQVSNGVATTAIQANPVSNLITAKVKYASNNQNAPKLIYAPKAGGGAGCSFNKNASFDPVFYLLLLIAFYYFRRKIFNRLFSIFVV